MPTKQLLPAARSWGTRFDSLPPSSPPASPNFQNSPLRDVQHSDDENASFDASDKRKDEKMPHDASVFVGSLPTNIDQVELSRLLSSHLSEHAQVKNVKVVRDSKGGVCAFVQCEDAAAATSLINTLHSTEPKPFLGRHLRYEPARAFRTLLISYRTPTQFIPNAENNPAEYGRGKHVELDLPYAMRLWKPRNSRYLAILYNAEAVEAEAQSSVNQVDSHIEHVMHLQPVKCDDETIRIICSHFGELESFKTWKPEENSDVDSEVDDSRNVYCYPHNARRSPNMDERCFEIKWAHRDDCVNALMTLRRVPHLTVTWAHQPNSFGGRQSPYQNTRTPNATLYPLYLNDPDRLPVRSTNALFSSGSRRGSLPDTSGNPGNVSASSATAGWKVLPQAARHPDATVTSMTSTLVDTSIPGTIQGEWNDMDFPPLVDAKGERKADFGGVWGENKLLFHKDSEVDVDGMRSAVASRPFSHSRETYEVSKPVFTSDKGEGIGRDLEQELDMPPTPGLGMSPITPRTPGVMFPATPTNANGSFHGIFAFDEYESKMKAGYHCEEPLQGERALDPTTLFVGGLEMYGPNAWDEEKVANFFKKFGGLESVKVVRPVNGKAAFAFVKFDNTDSPAKAVSQEHNRIYEGRAMRVQLRDCNPPRGNWKYGARGRGRYPMANGVTYHSYGDAEIPRREQKLRPDPIHPHEHHDQPSVDVAKSPSSLSKPAEPDSPHRATETQESRDAQTSRSQDQEKSKDDSPAVETYREWYDNVPSSATMTPPPVIYNSAVPVPGPPGGSNVQYPMPSSGGYYPHPLWMPSYGPQIQYQMPFYPGYANAGMATGFATPQPTPSQGYTSNAGSDASGPASAPPIPVQGVWPPMGMYGAYIPYPAFPTRPPPSGDSGTVQSTTQHQQPPVVPTGFIQNDQGTLIAVYPPEALDQYMTAGGQPAPGTQGQGPNIQNWAQSQPPTFVNVPPRMNPGMQTRHMLVPPPNWIHPSQSSTFPASHSGGNQSIPSSGSVPLPVSHSFRVTGHDLNVNQLNPSLRRNTGRRDQSFIPKGNNRSMANRNGRSSAQENAGGGIEGPHRAMTFASPQFA